MRILFIRHGDPDYVNDTLTEKGHREAVCLAEAAADLRMGDCYMSTLGRAQHTAAYSLKKIEKNAPVLDWLQEFSGTYQLRGPWDILPSYWTETL